MHICNIFFPYGSQVGLNWFGFDLAGSSQKMFSWNCKNANNYLPIT